MASRFVVLILSSELVERARQLNPDIKFEQGNMFALNAADATWAGIVAFIPSFTFPVPIIYLSFRK